MTISDQKAFDSILSMAQNMLRLAGERTQTPVTPEMIDKELKKLAIMMEEDFALVDREALVDELIRRSSRTVGENATLSSGDDHIAWLNADRKRGWTYWQRYSEYMEARIPWTALDALDLATDEVLSQLEDPTREGAWDRRGLVVGHVQSGKTGNYTGLICKAADSGYKIIIVLAGLHNNLRAQTQIRLTVRRKNGRPKIMPPADYRPSEDQTQDPHVLRAIGRAWGWRRRMDAGDFATIQELAEAVGLAERHVSRQLRLAYLAPEVLKRLTCGREASAVSLYDLCFLAGEAWGVQVAQAVGDASARTT